MSEIKVTVHIRVDPEVRDQLRKHAKQERRSVSGMGEVAIIAGLATLDRPATKESAS